jgi:hypothetical protein
MNVRAVSAELRDVLATYGEQGIRAGEMLVSAHWLLEVPDLPRRSEAVAWACREALESILKLAEGSHGLKAAAREVVQAWQLTQAGPQGDASVFEEKLKALQVEVNHPGGYHARRLLQVIRRHTNFEPLPQQEAAAHRWAKLVREANGGLHANLDDKGASRLYSGTYQAIDSLFSPLIGRLEFIDRVLTVSTPGATELAQLQAWSSDPRALQYFFTKVDGKQWLDLLDGTDLLDPADRGWLALPFLDRLASAAPDAVATWLERKGDVIGAAPSVAVLYMPLARTLGISAVSFVRRLKSQVQHPAVRRELTWWLSGLPVQHRGNDGALAVAVVVIDSTNTRPRDMYELQRALDVVVDAAQYGNAERVLRMLSGKVARAMAANPYAAAWLPDLTNLVEAEKGQAGNMPGLYERETALVVALVRALAAATAGGIALDRCERAIAPLPVEIRMRVLAAHLHDRVPAHNERAVDLLIEAVATIEPTPELAGLAALLTAATDPALERRLISELGESPTLEELASAPADRLPESWRRPFWWLAALPTTDTAHWQTAAAVLTAKYGPPSPTRPPVLAAWTRVEEASPYSKEELQDLAPIEAATKIASWRPSETGAFSPTVFGLTDVLREVIQARPAPWQEAPIEIIGALRHPVYIAGYFDALVQLDASLDPDAAPALATAAAFAAQTPWPAPSLSPLTPDPAPPAGIEWRGVRSSAVLLIRRLWAEAHDLGDAQADAWRLVVEAARDRDDDPHASERDAMDGALHRPSMQALAACFVYAAQQVRADRPMPAPFLDLLDDTLELQGLDGLHARAVIAQRLEWLRQAAPDWFAGRQERLIGTAAPDNLGQRTWDLHMAWGPSSLHLLRLLPDRYLDGLARGQQAALPRILTAMLSNVAPWADVSWTIRQLANIDPQWVSQGAENLGYSLQAEHDSQDLPINAWRYWEAALTTTTTTTTTTLPSVAFPGFGQYAGVTLLDQDAWLAMTERSLVAVGGSLDGSYEVAKRAAKSPHDPRAIHIITALLRHPADRWETAVLIDVGREALADSAESLRDHPARATLRNVLVERGDYDARNIP